MHRTTMVSLLAGLLLMSGGCDSEPGNDGGLDGAPDTDAASPSGFALSVRWTPCSLISEGSDTRAECATIEVPLFWSEPEGERITLFLKRAPGTPGAGQAWFLTGGPGQSASDMEALVEQLITVDPAKTYYLLDHRGVGRSTRLRCESSEGVESPNSIGLGEGEIAACLEDVRREWTDEQLAGFSSDGAGEDLGQLIGHLRVDDELVGIWGGSYGTHWLERYLNRFPAQASSVVFTAVALDVDLMSVDRWVDDVTFRWLDACDADASCGPRFQATFGSTAREVVGDTFGGSDAALCPEIEALGIDVGVLKPFFGQLFSALEGRSFFAPIAYRIARCEPRDVAAITQLVAALSPPPGPPEIPYGVRQWGFVLSENIAVSELTRERTAEEVRADCDAAVAVQGATPRLVESRAVWPRYDAPPFTNSGFQGAVLLLHGEYDFLPEQAYRRTVDHYLESNPNAEFVLLPGAPHSLESPTPDGGQCGVSLAIARLLDPEAPLPDCAPQVLPPVFAPPAAVSMALFATEDPWDGVPAGTMGRASGFLPSTGTPAASLRVRASSVRLLGGTPPLAPPRGLPALSPR